MIRTLKLLRHSSKLLKSSSLINQAKNFSLYQPIPIKQFSEYIIPDYIPNYQNDPKIKVTLKTSDTLPERHIGPRPEDQQKMLKLLGYQNLEDFVKGVIPEAVQDKQAFVYEGKTLESPKSEYKFIQSMTQLMKQNKTYRNFIGYGYKNVVTPTIIIRSILENPVWYTSYTPYQSEISQGRLTSLLNYQTMIAELTGLDVSNSSLLDEATAAAEAMLLSYSEHKQKRKTYFIADNLFPQTVDVMQTRAKYLNIKVVRGDPFTFNFEEHQNDLIGAIFQNPDNFGLIKDYTKLTERLKKIKCIPTLACDLLALTKMKTPGEMGFEIACGSTGQFGTQLGYGGPHAAFFATTFKYIRKLPGRLVGISKDANGNEAYRLALQAREQHIKREKAISNICTAQALLANITAMYGIYHGPKGLTNIANRINELTQIFAHYMKQLGYSIKGDNEKECNYFDTICIELPKNNADAIIQEFEKNEINIRKIYNNLVAVCFDETTYLEDISELLLLFAKIANKQLDKKTLFYDIDKYVKQLPDGLQRKSKFMSQQVFNTYHSEQQLQRYIHQLQDKDISLAKSMIPLGSCTMKLNATTTLLPLSWQSISLHPLQPDYQAKGYHKMIEQLYDWLRIITKLDAFSFQPNSGAQGEYAGLITIRSFHQALNQSFRNVCLIPKSSHGTNPASAVLAGLDIVPVNSDPLGNIDLKDLKEKAEKHKAKLSSLMITYPSTHGVFEEKIKEYCNIIHFFGGQVYMDGANMNAQVGWTSPGYLGADVCHLNLHKTFAIPHGGGGPGMGPIGVKEHLAKFLPGHIFYKAQAKEQFDFHFYSHGSVASSPWSSASILAIPYSYISLMGNKLRDATSVAILNANYLRHKLKDHYKIMYTGQNQMCAHEFIIDMKALKAKTGINEEDVAKRLQDFGFHAPTMSFPVPNSLMIEPTESEDLQELDRFADALIKIRQEIDMVEKGVYDRKDNPLKNAPHTQAFVTKAEWKHCYSRQDAAYPLKWVLDLGKLWPAVGRIDNAYGDRNIKCKFDH